MKSKNKTIQKGVQPKLRFPEFRGDDGWSNEKFETLYSFKPTNSLSREKLNYKSGKIKNIHYGDIHTKFRTLFDIDKECVPFINESENTKKYKQDSFCIEGDIIFADASEDLEDVGKSIEIVKLNNQKLLSGLHTLLARQKSKKMIVGFGGFLFQSGLIRNQIKQQSQGTKVLGISSGRLSSIQVYFPSKNKEQQKIADCLSSLDELIEAEGGKLEALKTHKRGLIQKLFPAEGETLPQLRFPEFQNAGEWEEKRLFEVVYPVLREVEKPNSNYLGIGIRSHGKGTFHKPNQDPTKNSMENLYLIHYNDLIVSITFAWEGAIAIANKKDHGGYVSHRFPTYDFNDNISTADFFRYIITQKEFVHKLRLISPGGAGRNRVLSKKDLLNISVLLPSLPEQKTIANCLSSLDEWIEIEWQKLEALKIHKKGLMQQLFPTISEVQE